MNTSLFFWYFSLINACQQVSHSELQATEMYRPSVINTIINSREAYATSDLVTPHPTKPGYYRCVGRTDDQIMHSTGEKTNPGPLGAVALLTENST